MSITKTPTGFMIEPDLDFTDNLFEFPVLMTMDKKRDENQNKLRKLGLIDDEEDDDEEEGERVVGMIAFPHESIVGYGDWYTPGKTPEEVRRFGFDVTEVYIRGEFQSYWCVWNRDTFKKRLNDHVRDLMKRRSDSVYSQFNLLKMTANDDAAKSNGSHTEGV